MGPACELFGYPGLVAFGQNGSSIPLTLKRETGKAPSTVVLSPGGKASLHFQAGGGSCRRAVEIEITPPNDYHQLRLLANGFAVCGNGTVFGNAVHAGVASP